VIDGYTTGSGVREELKVYPCPYMPEGWTVIEDSLGYTIVQPDGASFPIEKFPFCIPRPPFNFEYRDLLPWLPQERFL
jgi:hypothetical protein